MTQAQKIDHFTGQISGIDYDHREGGKYAYVKFLSITRDVLTLLRPIHKTMGEVRAIEDIDALFNTYLTDRFGEQQRIAFDLKRREVLHILENLRGNLQ